MKKFALLMTGVAALSLAGCGGQKAEEAAPAETAAAAPAEAASAAAPAEGASAAAPAADASAAAPAEAAGDDDRGGDTNK